LKRGQVIEEKRLPLYGNSLSSFNNIASSDKFIYVSTANPKRNSTEILIYKLNTPIALSLFASFDLPKNFSSSGMTMSVNFR